MDTGDRWTRWTGWAAGVPRGLLCPSQRPPGRRPSSREGIGLSPPCGRGPEPPTPLSSPGGAALGSPGNARRGEAPRGRAQVARGRGAWVPGEVAAREGPAAASTWLGRAQGSAVTAWWAATRKPSGTPAGGSGRSRAGRRATGAVADPVPRLSLTALAPQAPQTGRPEGQKSVFSVLEAGRPLGHQVSHFSRCSCEVLFGRTESVDSSRAEHPPPTRWALRGQVKASLPSRAAGKA